ncbi:UDP-3-O-[3-hydroxymyristoyl] N-acetylglucosamine deacetylase [Variibacter gotjawalensis]|uniref:UDP-3-O-acyl-N-acetylglucosamine deacetylase n=1 Tax=Variibacter gotjawalensis TaxID=1333996 RepID=A0A0S3PTN7_9BRAD|nr:UDP-3-O-acyl-N-acetylglucosamine deacetylase [Variibacter gotjawalensis]NIK49639.1 UDP-3-O-[3-hydroxymyristoyl] N-acetylglucosamine deacetylase [Variibacter gotjawalensis]RZS45651.1 UDP-3-O-[3-hydroxymyristoyl] N-acetylglucosamine deacetylase [Variibacter gotjawalensis]BAT59322.1 UDP-3-O-[3-hydroxymyristoyl] N-acetylglucosamine deacetylase [Variibacter gotjawalensis]
MQVNQTTLRKSLALSGAGVHSGRPVQLSIHPAPANSGYLFLRKDGEQTRQVRAEPAAVVAAEYATVLGDASGPVVATIEHVLAALYGMGVDNAMIEVDGPEMPIMDGSAAPFVDAIEAAGIKTLSAKRRYLKVLKPVGVMSGKAYAELRPNASGFRVECEIEFDCDVIGNQSYALEVEADTFASEVASARTFGFLEDLQTLLDAGYARGASLDNTVVVGEGKVVNQEGLRYADEFVRHKALDAVGDLALAGLPILGAYHSVRGGHRLNYAVLSALLADRSAWTIVEATERSARRPIFRPSLGLSEVGLRGQPAFSADRT